MKKFGITVLALLGVLSLGGCALNAKIGTQLIGTKADPGIVRVDIQNALDGATANGDQFGIQCHTQGLVVLDAFTTSNVKVTGVVSAAEAVRVSQLAFTRVLPLWLDIKDKCAVFNFGTLLRPFVPNF